MTSFEPVVTLHCLPFTLHLLYRKFNVQYMPYAKCRKFSSCSKMYFILLFIMFLNLAVRHDKSKVTVKKPPHQAAPTSLRKVSGMLKMCYDSEPPCWILNVAVCSLLHRFSLTTTPRVCVCRWRWRRQTSWWPYRSTLKGKMCWSLEQQVSWARCSAVQICIQQTQSQPEANTRHKLS